MKQWKKPSMVLFAVTLLIGTIASVCFLPVPNTLRAAEVENQAKTNTDTDTDSMTLEIKHASVDLGEDTGPDGTFLYYVDASKIIFGGCFGLFVYDKTSGKIVQSLDLKYIGCNATQGDNYCQITVDKNGRMVYLKPIQQKKLYILDLLSDTLEVRDNPKSDIWQDRSFNLFRVDDIKQASYYDGGEKRICILNEGDLTIGDCAYAEYTPSETDRKEKMVYYPLFSHTNREVMENYVIIAVLILAVGFSTFSAIRHFKGQGGCCGGGSYKPKKKKLKNVLYQKTFKVAGMHCGHCKNRVEEAVNDINGVAGKVDLRKGELTVSYAEEVADEVMKARIKRAGYTVTEIKDK